MREHLILCAHCETRSVAAKKKMVKRVLQEPVEHDYVLPLLVVHIIH